MQKLASQTNVRIKTLRETDYLTVKILNRCRSSKNSFWQETFKSYIKIRENFLAEYSNHMLLHLIIGNNQLSLDGRPANIPSMHRKTLATTVNPKFSLQSPTQYMRLHEGIKWIEKQKCVLNILAIKMTLKTT